MEEVASWDFFPCPKYSSHRYKIFLQDSAKVLENKLYALMKLNTVSLIHSKTSQCHPLHRTYTLDASLVSHFLCVAR